MTFTRALSTNNYGPSKFIVDGTTAANGTHSTISSAITSASSGDTIFIRPGTYTENLTLKAGVNLTAYNCDAYNPNVIISGNCTFSAAGSVACSGIRFQTNSANCITVSGSSASILTLVNCFINCTNNTGISFTSSNAGSFLILRYCLGNVATTGITYFSHSGAGTLEIGFSSLTNSGDTTAASTVSGTGVLACYNSRINVPITTSSSGVIQGQSTLFDSDSNTTAITHGGSASNSFLANCQINGGTASAISIGSTLNLGLCVVDSTNTNAITGAGTLLNGGISFSNTSSTINTTTQTPRTFRYGFSRSTNQPGFLAYLNTQDTNVTGNGATYTLGSGNALTEVYDQNGDFNTNGTFTAPVTGRYYLEYVQGFGALTSAMTSCAIRIITSNNTFLLSNFSTGTAMNSAGIYVGGGSVYCDMDAGDTAIFTSVIGNGAGNIVTSLAPTGGSIRTFVSGFLMC